MQQSSEFRLLAMEQRVDRLQARVDKLECASEMPSPSVSPSISKSQARVEIPEPKIETPPVEAPREPQPPFVPPPALTPPQQSVAARRPVRSAMDWETLLGGRWALWLGALCLFLSVASLVAYSWKTLPPPPPWARVAIGIGASLALLAAGHLTRGRGPRWFSEGMQGAGLAVGYLSAWAGSQVFGLWGGAISTLALFVWTVLGTGLALRFEARSLLVLATLGGFLTPAFAEQSGSARPLGLLVYLAVLVAGVVFVAAQKTWRETLVLAALGALALLLLTPGPEIPALFQGAYALYFSIFAAAVVAPHWKNGRVLGGFDLLFLFAAEIAFWLLSAFLWPGQVQFFALAFAAFQAVLWIIHRRIVGADARLSLLFILSGGLSLLAFFPLQSGANGTFWGWMFLTVAFDFLGERWGEKLFLRAARWVWSGSVGALALLAIEVPTDGQVALFCAVGASLWLLWSARKRGENGTFLPLCAGFVTWGGALFLATLPPSIQQFSNEGAVTIGILLVLSWALLMIRAGLLGHLKSLENNGWVLGSLTLLVALFFCFSDENVGVIAFWNGRALLMTAGFGALVCAARWLRGYGTDEPARECALALALFWGTLGLWLEWARIPFSESVRPLWLAAVLTPPALVGVLVGFRARFEAIRHLSYALLYVALAGLLGLSLLYSSNWTPFWNARLAAFGVCLGSLLGVSWLQIHFANRLMPSEIEFRPFWVAPLFLLPLWATTQEIWNSAQVWGGPNAARFGSLGVSLWWSLFALGALVWGIYASRRGSRLAGLSLLGLTLGKVFLLDLAFLDGSLKVLSLGGLGGSLILVSWLYSRLERGEKSRIPHLDE